MKKDKNNDDLLESEIELMRRELEFLRHQVGLYENRIKSLEARKTDKSLESTSNANPLGAMYPSIGSLTNKRLG